MQYGNYNQIRKDSDLIQLHKHPKWHELMNTVMSNRVGDETVISVANQLDSIYEVDQKYRKEYLSMYEKHGNISLEMKVESILNSYGWLGPDEIGTKASESIFMVIQHSDNETRAKYLPMMIKAVMRNNISAKNLARLEDRTVLGEGKRQIYGTQLRRDSKTQEFYVRAIQDSDNVDMRRSKIGLESISDYLNEWGISWSLHEHKLKFPPEDN